MSKNNRKNRQIRKLAILNAADKTGWTQHTEYHWSKSVCGLRFDYWPSGRKAMFNGQVYRNIDCIRDLEASIIRNFSKN